MNSLSHALAFVTIFGLASQPCAAIIEVDLTVPLSSVQYVAQGIDDQQLSLSTAAPSFIVSNGDTVRVKWIFSNGDTFQLLPDPHIGLQGALILADRLTPSYVVQFGPTWSFLNGAGVPILAGSEQRQGQAGGDLRSGGLTVANPSTIDVGGLLMEL